MQTDQNPSEEKIKLLIIAEIDRQLERERTIIKGAIGAASKIVAGALAFGLAIFAVFGIKTWGDIKEGAIEEARIQTEAIIKSEDAKTGVKQYLNDLVNRSIVTSALIRHVKDGGEILLPDEQWNRIRKWIQIEQLSDDDFRDGLSVLAHQSKQRKEQDVNIFLEALLTGNDVSTKWIKKHPEKRKAILDVFVYHGLSSAAVKVAQSNEETSDLRIYAIDFLRENGSKEVLESLFKISESSNSELRDSDDCRCSSNFPGRSKNNRLY